VRSLIGRYDLVFLNSGRFVEAVSEERP
jgi:hypothetical protein